MSDRRFDDDSMEYEGFERHDIMDKLGAGLSSVFSRRSRVKDKDDDLLSEISAGGKDDGYELFVDERAVRRRSEKARKASEKQRKKDKPKKPVTPLMRRIRNIITCCVIVAVVLIVCVVLSLTVLFKTQNYAVSGNTKYDEADIIATCAIGKNENIFLANKKAAEKRLKKTYAYIEEVDVSFAIPDTITVDITEAMPAYIVKVTDSSYLIASTKGRILEQVEDYKSYDLPLFLGSELSSSEVGGYVKFADETTLKIIDEIVTVFADNGYTGITEIDATDTANITFTYDNRIKVKLGLPEDISYKVRTAMTIITEKLDLNGSNSTEGELDVSNCNVTKKSYFREQSLIDSQVETTAPNSSDTDDTTDEWYDGEDTYEEPTEEVTISQDEWYLD